MAAQRLGDRAHVAAGADVDREPGDTAVVVEELERVHRRPTHRHLDLDASAVQLVRALAADLHRRGCRDAQVDLAAQRVDPRLELARGQRLVLVDDLAFGIAGRGGPREVDCRLVALGDARRSAAPLS